MKKTLLSILLLLLTLSVFGLGRNDGSSKAHSIDFDWTNGHVQEAGATALWYRIPLSPIYEYDYPQLSLTLTNLSSDSAHLSLSATMGDLYGEKTYAIAANTSHSWIPDEDMILSLDGDYMFITLLTDQRVMIQASVTEAPTALHDTYHHATAQPRLILSTDGQVLILRGTDRYTLTGAKL